MSWHDGEDTQRGLWFGPQFDELEGSFTKDAVLRIALVHHPSEAIHPHDTEWTWDRIEKKCSVLLHGHLHKPRAFLKRTPECVLFSISGGSVHKNGGLWHSQHYSYSRFNLETKELNVHVRMTTDERPDPIYTRDTQTYPEGSANGHIKLSLA
jgi:predicted phosphodiesterase